MSRHKWDFRDVSAGLQFLREFLLGRKHHLHGRFPPLIAPRTIPPPDIPRGPEYKYSKQYYYKRNALHSVLPPVVAPVAEGPPVDRDRTKKSQPGGMKPDSVPFNCAPTPGLPWWWDGHSYYENQPDPCCPPCPCPPSAPCAESKPPSKCAPPPCPPGNMKK
ncbi:hypothetical protein K1T71_009251 [Dendrolimus kikuchii]|uniref:Uncharacterized protein n=1 Tax=Dendrolimus kikuchii TaxID=765133 RepID=A0ACC1CU15_9NEOP|nr:hypothetical protein K1T71_009251 [Dendrolimus kikuchii]